MAIAKIKNSELLPPANVQAEQQLLGALMLHNASYHAVAEFLRAEMFAVEAHQRIYEAIGATVEKGRTASHVTLRHYFEQKAALAEVGGGDYLFKLAQSVVVTHVAPQHARIVQDLYLRRCLIRVAQDTLERAYDPEIEVSGCDMVAQASADLDGLAAGAADDSEPRLIGEHHEAALEAADRAWKSPDHVSGFTWGIERLDKKTGGLHPEDLVVLAGRPSMGKTALARCIARANATRWSRFLTRQDGVPRDQWPTPTPADGAAVLFFSMEMSGLQQAQMDMAGETGISSDRQRKGDFHEHEFDQMMQWSLGERDLPIYVDDTPNLTLARLRARSRRMVRTKGVRLLVIDYLQLLTIDARADRKYEGRVQELTAITRGLKGLARSLKVPVVALCQLSRAVEQREDKRPQLADLRESGSIEQDADVIGLLYRDEYYLEREEPNRRASESDKTFNERVLGWQNALGKSRGLCEVFFGKQRMGPIGKVVVGFDVERARFKD